MNEPWHKIQEQVRGRRLAVYDDLLEFKTIDTTDLAVQGALGWLIFHQLVVREGDVLRARTFREAAAAWQRVGAAREAAAKSVAGTHVATKPIEEEPAPAVPRVHTHQTRLFA